ncbi:glutamine synthetase [Pseudomonas syringae pv. actinidiae ICMP 9853]|uniref:Glutamine synthetase n=3 Tax=Pseudomonas syringae TaxID=317 RepID=A0A2V0QE50_PSESF|nr:glutamine synthetase [Pseudomonas syringae pv. actinidiae ICMP 9853]EGH67802.1 glutamine synthetase [Pseudomonas syringae pv. actinidiae str. M302091]EPM86530.1 glutamine synthetase [Pseudomonas syringae pv. actinidiae ICMP 19068]EPM95542.1 glutamine synthetase [Pseudomonas syringae pv. actinidiae ICMP 19104]EPN02940.1 glutamine synthetase [Pseudomonas syringae pv. actinidiae ICMP 19102]EPN09899.1 glutamine synthetase [Pseudomonas syringae pv. actinidiae ICMP 9855]KCU96757.1 glutamine synt
MTRNDPHSLAQLLMGIDEVECVTPDLNGVPRGKVMTTARFLEGRRLQLARGVLLQCIMGGYPPARFYGSDDGDLALVSDPQQVHRLPWSEQPRALAICDAEELSGERCLLSTRGQLKSVIARYAARGLAPVVATELEFFVFAANPEPLQPFVPPLGLDGRRELGHSAFSISSNNGLRPFFAEVYACMAALGLPRDTVMHEMGVSQFEINLLHGDPLLLADQTFLFKHLLKEVALKHGLIVVCMAKPLAHTAGSSMHIHQSVVATESGQNVFSDASGEATDTFRHFIGGQQACMADFTALFAPNVNSYQRLYHPYASPNNACWSHDNRAAGLRIPASAAVARRVENRLPGADANPYLAIAASLAAGLHGIEQRLEPTAPMQGEIQAPKELSLPCTLHAALERLKSSQLAKELFGHEFIEGYVASKSLELTSFFDEITPWERRVLAAQV